MGFFLALFSGLCLRSPQGRLPRSLCCSLTPSPCQGSLVQGQCPIQSKFHLGLVLARPEACLTICVGLCALPGPSKIFHPFFWLQFSISRLQLVSSLNQENMKLYTEILFL